MRLLTLTAILSLTLTGTGWAQSGLFVLTSDFTTGSAAYLPPGAGQAQVNLLNLHGDAVASFQGGLVYVVNRLGQDNVLVLDPQDLTAPLRQFSTGNGTNPHDIEILSQDKAYVTLYDAAHLLVVDPRDGTQLSTIDLSAFADGDGLPEASQVVRIGPRAYVSCQRLDRNDNFAPSSGVLVVVDIATDTVVGDIALSAANPNSVLVVGDRIVVSGSAGFADRAGGIDIVDPAAAVSLGLAVTEQQLGGDLTQLVLRTSRHGFAVVLDESFSNVVVPVDLATGAVGAPLEGLSGGFVPALAIDGDRLIVGDQGSFDDPAAAGLKIFDALSGAFRAGPIDTGLPPNDIVVLAETVITAVAAAPGTALPTASRLDHGYPNPFNASVRIPFHIGLDGAVGGTTAVRLEVVDVLGRSVRLLAAAEYGPGRHAVIWDGRDGRGRRVGNGPYFVRLRAGGQVDTARLMLLE